jgi:hypothetical protein
MSVLDVPAKRKIIFVEQNPTKERFRQPPPPKKMETIVLAQFFQTTLQV